ncbi:MAG: starch-binding protein [Ruminococcaceae bacterium]|nr:starch-binding protein [Oscillospiraceae bacterium]
MTYDEATGYYKMVLEGVLAYGKVIFAESSYAYINRYPSNGAEGLSINGKDMLFSAGYTWEEYVPAPVVPTVEATIYFDNTPYNWSSVYAYVYTDSEENSSWPGVLMTYDETTGYYKLLLEGALANGKVIFTESNSATTNRYPSDQEQGLDIGGKDMIFLKNNTWKEYVSELVPTNSKYYSDGELLLGVSEKTYVSDLLSAFESNNLVVYDSEGNVISDSQPVGTGYRVCLVENGEIVDYIEVMIKGDVDGNGEVDSTDYLKIKQHFLGTYTVNGVYELASDIDNNGKIDTTDYIRIKSHFLGAFDLYA